MRTGFTGCFNRGKVGQASRPTALERAAQTTETVQIGTEASWQARIAILAAKASEQEQAGEGDGVVKINEKGTKYD
jgi:hypothetical protein